MKLLKALQLYAQLALLLMIAVTTEAAATDYNQAKPGCTKTCGNVSIPFPFGIGKSTLTRENCFLEEQFEVTCNSSTLYSGNVPTLNISFQGQLWLESLVAKVCYDSTLGPNETKTDTKTLRGGLSFTVSSKENKFISVGCDTYGYLNSFRHGSTYSTGCLTRCYEIPEDDMVKAENSGNCSGIGCCQVDIPPGMRNISLQAFSFNNFNTSSNFRNCSYSFVAKQGSYNFSISHLKNLPSAEKIPMVIDWTVGNESCQTSQSKPNLPNFACKKNSYCDDKDIAYGYRCRCKQGYDGNPYLDDGCTDIKECTTAKHNCTSDDNCREKEGGFECFCPKGQLGDGTKAGGCRRKSVLIQAVIGGVVGLIALFVGISSLCIKYLNRRFIKQKEKFFKQNGGFILQQQLSTRRDSSQTAQIFTADQLKQATNNYDESLIIGKGGFGTVFKGFLSDNRIVAVKKSKIVDQNQIEQFINEVIVLSQINHRNVVKLLGCCLETEVPSLVFEFVNNGTLFEYIHSESSKTSASWKTRLRIATEAAAALSYLHSAASIPIIHRDVKSANILLDDTYTAKVSDFGASRLVPLDQTELATMVQGTFGYLDPEYMQTSQLTEKSDVYSFGVVLVELLTGEKALSLDRPEEKRCLAMHFLSYMKEDRLFEIIQNVIVNEENKEEIKEVAILAMKCLRLKGEERPSMKEVAMELEGIRLMENHPWPNGEQNLEETQHLLHEASGIYEHGDSSSHQNAAYDSIKDHVLVVFDDGR